MDVQFTCSQMLFFGAQALWHRRAGAVTQRAGRNSRVIATALVAWFVALCSFANAATNDGAWTPITVDQGSVQFNAHVSGDPVRVRLGSASPSSSIVESFVLAHRRSDDPDQASIPLAERPPIIDLPLLIESRRIVLPTVYRVAAMATDMHLGRDFFSDAIVQIDYPNLRLRVLDEDALTLRQLANVPARRVNEQIGTHIRIEIQGQMVWAAMATEYSGALMIPRVVAREHDWIQGDDVELGEVLDSDGNPLLSEGIALSDVTIGPYRITDVQAVIMEDGESPLAGSYDQTTAIVGNDLLKYFQLSVDLDRAYVHVQTP